MKIIFLFIFTLCGYLNSGRASTKSLLNAPNMDGYFVRVDFQHSLNAKIVESSGELIIAKENSGWVTLVNANNGFTVLGRVIEEKNGVLQMEYIIVDASKTPNGVISTPRLTTVLNEKALIKIGNESETTTLEVLARKTRYTN